MMYGSEFGKHMTELFKDKPNTEETRKLIQLHLADALQQKADKGTARVDHEKKIVTVWHGTEELAFIVPTLPEDVRYEVYMFDERIGHVTYKGVQTIGSSLVFKSEYEPEQPVETIKITTKLD